MEQAFTRCAQAMAKAKFKNVRVEVAAAMVTGARRAAGQWTSSAVTLFLAGAEGGKVSVTIRADATAHSLVSLAFSPGERMVRDVAAELQR
jgi:hypothetical protein